MPVLLHGPEKRPERRRYLPDKNSYPLQKDRRGQYKIRRGEMLWVCMTSDFFLPEADPWRDDAWDMIRMRPDVIFFLLTKRPQRVSACLPEDWGNGWENVFFHVACENQIRAEERIPFPPLPSQGRLLHASPGAHLPALPSPFAMDARTVKSAAPCKEKCPTECSYRSVSSSVLSLPLQNVYPPWAAAVCSLCLPI